MCFKEERDRDFLQAYHEALRSFGKKAPFVSRTEVIRKALNSGSPRFYVTYEEARRNVRRLMKENPVPCSTMLYSRFWPNIKLPVSIWERRVRKYCCINYRKGRGHEKYGIYGNIIVSFYRNLCIVLFCRKVVWCWLLVGMCCPSSGIYFTFIFFLSCKFYSSVSQYACFWEYISGSCVPGG